MQKNFTAGLKLQSLRDFCFQDWPLGTWLVNSSLHWCKPFWNYSSPLFLAQVYAEYLISFCEIGILAQVQQRMPMWPAPDKPIKTVPGQTLGLGVESLVASPEQTMYTCGCVFIVEGKVHSIQPLKGRENHLKKFAHEVLQSLPASFLL